MTRPQGQMPISVYIFLSEYHYLGTRKPNKRIYPLISNWRVDMKKSLHFSNFFGIFADFHGICSGFLRFSRKCRKTLHLFKISRFQLNFHHHYTGDSFNLLFSFNLISPSRPPAATLCYTTLPLGGQLASRPAACSAAEVPAGVA